MRLDSASDAASPSGRPDIGGSGSPAPSTTRPGDAGCGLPGGTADDAVAGLADALPVAAEPGSEAALKGTAGGFAAVRARPEAIASTPTVEVAEPAATRSRGAAPPVGPSGGGCDGRPAATRWRAAEASGSSGGEDWPAEAAGPPDGWSDRSASDGAGSEAAGEALGSGGSRPLLPGGVFPEFTANTPRRHAP
jgi:hypothetical protein